MARDVIPAYTDDLSRFSDLELYAMYEDETEPNTKQLLRNECDWRAKTFCMAQGVN